MSVLLGLGSIFACGGESGPVGPSCPHCCNCGCAVGTITITADDRCIDCEADCQSICLEYGGTPPELVEACEDMP